MRAKPGALSVSLPVLTRALALSAIRVGSISELSLTLELVAEPARQKANSSPRNYSLLFPAFFALAHLALAAAESAALAAALNFLLGLRAGLADGAVRLIFAHLALAAARMLASPCALIFRFFGFLGASMAAVSSRPPRS